VREPFLLCNLSVRGDQATLIRHLLVASTLVRPCLRLATE
jgi:hypothetical protein